MNSTRNCGGVSNCVCSQVIVLGNTTYVKQKGIANISGYGSEGIEKSFAEHAACGKEDWVWQICDYLYSEWVCDWILRAQRPEGTCLKTCRALYSLDPSSHCHTARNLSMKRTGCRDSEIRHIS